MMHWSRMFCLGVMVLAAACAAGTLYGAVSGETRADFEAGCERHFTGSDLGRCLGYVDGEVVENTFAGSLMVVLVALVPCVYRMVEGTWPWVVERNSAWSPGR